jgi:hypothetical protein
MQQLQPSQAQQQFQQQLQQQQSHSPPSTAASSSSSGQLLAAPVSRRPGGHNSAHSISLAPWGTTTPGGSNGHNTEQVHVVPSFDQDAQPLAQVTDGAFFLSAAGAPGAAGGAPAVSDTVLLGMAAAVADPTQGSGYALLPISCPSCANLFQIVDCGEAMSYSCPFCSAQTII